MKFVKLKCNAREYVCQEPSCPWYLSLISLTAAASCPASLEPFAPLAVLHCYCWQTEVRVLEKLSEASTVRLRRDKYHKANL